MMELLAFQIIFTHYCHYHQLMDMICFPEHRGLRTVGLLRVPKSPFQKALLSLSSLFSLWYSDFYFFFPY